QEPGSAETIQTFCQKNYDVSFTIMEKSDVNGNEENSVFKYIKAAKPGLLGLKRVKWNFEKFLIDRQGNVVERWASTTSPKDIAPFIEKLFNQQPLATSAADQGIARLLQTVKDADALVTDEHNANANTAATVTQSSTEVVMDDANAKPSDSDSSSDSDSDSEFNADSDDDMDGGQRSLLQIMEDGDDDDAQPSSAVVKSRNEILEPEIPALPTTQLPDTVQLCPLGTVHSAVDRSVIIQANISGEVHVLDSESLVVFEDRSVL
ncbi:Glutathione peroxidase 2, partial [Coemansia sp. RSA 1937]